MRVSLLESATADATAITLLFLRLRVSSRFSRGKGVAEAVLSIAFRMRNRPGSIELDVFADANGFLAGVDVACNANSEPVPGNPELLDAPYHVHGPLMR
jgi:hypothetical protein